MYKCLVLLVVLFFSCKKNNSRDSTVIKTDKESLVILKSFKFSNRIVLGKSFVESSNPPVEIIDPYKIHSTIIELFNQKNDTIRIKHTNEIMIANIYYNPRIQNSYYLKPGDTLVIDFTDTNKIKEYYVNKNVLQGDLNKIDVIDSITFNLLNFSNDRIFELKYEKNDSIKQSNLYKRLDSLNKNKLINNAIYELKKTDYILSLKSKSILGSESYLKKDDLIGLKSYQNLLRIYSLKKFDIKRLTSGNSFFLDYKSAFDSVYNSNNKFGSNAKQYLLFHYLDFMNEHVAYNDFKQRFDKFKRTATDTTLVHALENKYLLDFKDLKEEINEIYFINSHKKKQTLSQIMEQNKGKVIYVDFWASWCAPCRALMPSSRELHKEYHNKDVVFLYLSIDNDFDKWQKANRDEGLSQNRFSLLAVNYPNANFYKELNLRSIPRYLLFDKQGNLVHKNAPSPDSDIVRQEIDKLLRQ